MTGDGKLRMQRKNLYSSIFLILFSGVTFYLGSRLLVGHAGKPGPGFFPLLMSVFIGILALILLLSTVRSSKQPDSSDEEGPARKWKVLYVLGLLCVYAFLYRPVGYILSTWIFLVCLKPVIHTRWAPLLLASLIASTIFFVFFNTLLRVELPVGILRL